MSAFPSRSVFVVAAGAVAVLSGPGPVMAQDGYPVRPVRLVVPFPPGGSTDNLARVIVPRWAEALGQPITIENRGGAGGNIGVESVARAAPDGYTVGLFDTAFTP